MNALTLDMIIYLNTKGIEVYINNGRITKVVGRIFKNEKKGITDQS